MRDWGGDLVTGPDQPDVRWSPAEHYDQAMEVLNSMPAAEGGDAQLLTLGWMEVLAQVGLGILRAKMMELTGQ